ncbi:pallidipin-like [Rhodnius prolixus]|uniref:pallidipin-like n=1 Tax=Rhodnius prolixus TaxID=13249 RepID=UPI003D18A9B5
MCRFLAVTFFFQILTFAFAIDGDADDNDDDDGLSKCDDVKPMSDFDSNKYFKKLKHLYVTHAKGGGRLGVCLKFHTSKDSSGTIGYNYEFNGNGKPAEWIKAYTANCTGTEDSGQKGKFSFSCTQKFDLDLESIKKDLLKEATSEEEKAEVEKGIKNTGEGDHKDEFPQNVTVLSTDYEKYALIHSCADMKIENKTYLVDNYVVFNVNKDAKLPEGAKQKFKEYKWEEDKFATREICNNKEEIKK